MAGKDSVGRVARPLLKILFLLSFSVHAEYVEMDKKEQGRCVKILLATGSLDSAPIPDLVKEEQSHFLEALVDDYIRKHATTQRTANTPLHSLSSEPAPKHYEWPASALEYLKKYTGWPKPFGVAYNARENKTTFTVPADRSLVKGITLRIYRRHTDQVPVAQRELHHEGAEVNGGMAWTIEVEGSWEGLWYDFLYEAVDNQVSDLGESIPSSYRVVDPSAHWVAGDKARVYFPPVRNIPHAGTVDPNRPQSVSMTILEVNPGDLSFAKIPEDLRGTFGAIGSGQIWQLSDPFAAVEVMHLAECAPVEQCWDPAAGIRSRRILYFHSWGYMPTFLGAFASAMGGPEAALQMLNRLQNQKKAVIRDIVIQHTANKYDDNPHLNVWHFALRNVYRRGCEDLTGCGNVMNLDLNAPYTGFVFQTIIRDLLMYGFNGHRYDLFGAVPLETVRKLVELAHSLGAYISGEPYAANYHARGGWNTRHPELPRNAGLWDYRGRLEVRDAFLSHGTFWKVFSWLRGGTLNGTEHSTWSNDTWDRTFIVESHDGPTLAQLFGGDLSMVAFATTVQLAAQGDVLMYITQLFGLRHDLNNTPVDLSNLKFENRRLLEYSLKMVKMREKLRAFFSYPHLTEGKDVHTYAHHEAGVSQERTHRAGSMHFTRPAFGDSDYDLMILFNNAPEPFTLPLPDGEPWIPVADSRAALADPSLNGIYAPAIGSYSIDAKTAVWLVRRKP
ncbi:MAG: hypothetical protein AB7G93_15885 [Bdellovibrionales bacterium]